VGLAANGAAKWLYLASTEAPLLVALCQRVVGFVIVYLSDAPSSRWVHLEAPEIAKAFHINTEA
jgi:hypothetical protein